MENLVLKVQPFPTEIELLYQVRQNNSGPSMGNVCWQSEGNAVQQYKAVKKFPLPKTQQVNQSCVKK